MRIFKHIVLICILFSFYNSSAQTDSTYLNAEEVLEDLLQEPTNEEDDSNLYELIEQLLLNPIDINTAEVSELQQIPAIDLKTAKLIVNHRKKYGNFFSVVLVCGDPNDFCSRQRLDNICHYTPLTRRKRSNRRLADSCPVFQLYGGRRRRNDPRKTRLSL